MSLPASTSAGVEAAISCPMCGDGHHGPILPAEPRARLALYLAKDMHHGMKQAIIG
jgi:hypothetical protein